MITKTHDLVICCGSHGIIKFFHTVEDSKHFCGQCRSRSDCTERAV